ncbi:hypothetical protein LTS07_005432 [Exophiala sideris]|uniref:Methyltransferase domain-containing protein n=1 Tax=Exophiala sideris TaxID=1016849 RepID=A0ABR0JB88_9EURO|nr:hypothetical protein LTS07_005432 [Exophiala sideris]KAK5038702.1 hypothetical protein LTR13_004449 [Exophiala sideris]KAK5060583.1 hypothetical protein LTR69_005900 [Exophiala sideris]KAK5183495.1 hypothetical protein LTR44_004496 [Eurotiomycetes sp. CCFEE 6388]
MLDGKLHLAPIPATPQCVLDIATGSGIWAIEFAEQYPSAFVVANDLSPTQPSFIPPNVQFEIDDANEPWTYSRRFDFIHCRQHHCAIEEQKLFNQAFEFLQPGGWLEMQELCYPIRCDDGTLSDDCALSEWSRLLLDATVQVGQAANKPIQYEEWMQQAGFVNTRTVVYKWPTNSWPPDGKLKTMGLWNHYNALQGLQGFTVGLFTRILGWSLGKTDTLLMNVKKDLEDKDIHAYWPIQWQRYPDGPSRATRPRLLSPTSKRYQSGSTTAPVVKENLEAAHNEDEVAAEVDGRSLPSETSPTSDTTTSSSSSLRSSASPLDPTSPHHDIRSFHAYARRTGLDPTSTVYTGTSYEYLAQNTLRSHGFDLFRVGGRGDRGVDLVGLWHIPRVSKASGQWKEYTNRDGKTEVETNTLRVMVQCKRMVGKRAKIGPNLVRELEGAIRGARLGALFDALGPKEQADAADLETSGVAASGPAIGVLVGTKPATKGVLDTMRRSSRALVWIMMEEVNGEHADASDVTAPEPVSSADSDIDHAQRDTSSSLKEPNEQPEPELDSLNDALSQSDLDDDGSRNTHASALPTLEGRIKQILWNKAAGDMGLEDVHVVQRYDASGREEVVLMRGGRVWGGF